MLCPSCKSGSNKVIDSRLTDGGTAIRRRRVCSACKRRFTTKERVETDIRLSVIKNSGERVRYDRQKIFNGVERACYKLDINDDKLAELVDRVEEELLTNHDRKVTTEQIGIYVGAYLSRLSAVAYVRFMSVYRKFRTVDEFIEEVGHVRVRVARESPDQQSLFGR